MEKHTVNESSPSTIVWASLEARFRQQVQGVLQELLEEEVSEFLGRVKSQRRDPGAAAGTGPAAYRNGHGKPRQLLLDNAFIFHSTALQVMCAELEIELSFCRPRSPQGKPLIEYCSSLAT